MSSVVAQSQQTKPHWKVVAIREAGRIADAWEVFIAYGAQLAAWILFGCMVGNIIQMLPHVSLPDPVINLVMSVQIVTLDIAGFGLNTLAKHIAKHGNEDAKKVASGAKVLGKCLIGIMILTLLLIAIGWLYPDVKQYTDMADRLLILGRVILTVIYMHTMHDLREAQNETQSMLEQATQEKSEMAQRLEEMDRQLHTRLTTIEGSVAAVSRSGAQSVSQVEEKLQAFKAIITGQQQQQSDQIVSHISMLFDLFKMEMQEVKQTDELAAISSEVIPEDITPVIPPEIIEDITPEIVAEIPEKIAPQKAEKILENWDDVIEKFPGVNEWLSSGLRSVSVEQIMEVTNFNKIKIGKAKLRQTKNGNKRLENVLDWLRNTPVNIEAKKEAKKPRDTQPLNPGMLEDLEPVKSRDTIKLSIDDLPEEMRSTDSELVAVEV